MPPKKKKSGKKKKSAKKSARPSASNPLSDSLNELSREYYLIQIRDLEQRLVRYQKRCDELLVKNGQFQDKFDQMASDKKEIVSFWKKQVEQRTDEIATLNDRLIGLHQAKDAEKETYESQLRQIRTEFQETKDTLTSENMILGGKLSSLEEFKVQKEDLMAKFAELEAQLEQKEQDHKDVIYNLERKAVIDKDRLKKEMVLRVNQVAAEFRKVSNKQMADTTKRTIRENVSINAQLAKMSDKTMELIQENDEVKQKEKKHKQQIELLEANEKELAKKNHSNQKIIRMLTEKCRNQEEMIMEYESREEEFEELEKECQMYREQEESHHSELQGLTRDQELLQQQTREAENKMELARRDKLKLEKVLTDTAMALRLALRKESPDEEDEEMMEVERRDHMLENLLVLLNSAAAIGVGPLPGDLGKQYDIKQRSTKIPGSGKGIRKGQLSTTPGPATLPHYQLGDLGLIPRPQNHIPTSFDKTKGLSITTRLGALRKVLTRSVGIQTVSAPKAMFYADQLLKKAPPASQEAILRDLHSRERLGSPMALGPITSTKKLSSKAF